MCHVSDQHSVASHDWTYCVYSGVSDFRILNRLYANEMRTFLEENSKYFTGRDCRQR